MTITTTQSGLQYEDVTVGDGAEATAGKYVTVHYTGWLYENGQAGRKFDSSKDRNDPFAFSLGAGHVIKGWDEGVQGMKVGGTRKLIIPAELGYGARGAGRVIPRTQRCFSRSICWKSDPALESRPADAASHGRRPIPPLAGWQSGQCCGLQSRISRFDSVPRLQSPESGEPVLPRCWLPWLQGNRPARHPSTSPAPDLRPRQPVGQPAVRAPANRHVDAASQHRKWRPPDRRDRAGHGIAHRPEDAGARPTVAATP